MGVPSIEIGGPSVLFHATVRRLTFDASICVSGLKRCAPRSRPYVSQSFGFCCAPASIPALMPDAGCAGTAGAADIAGAGDVCAPGAGEHVNAISDAASIAANGRVVVCT